MHIWLTVLDNMLILRQQLMIYDKSKILIFLRVNIFKQFQASEGVGFEFFFETKSLTCFHGPD